ncbi:hypothetical protein [Hymenobacter negativus]|uniref:Uncharacterized protein n=1 Tax=Hymenobacter negativus TaxID=2795026 RepID=A0ABS3QI26_9BACT|nr:hypothetical protein [Hymenobacter negativus]MBO2010903.1 hypothetical protein [Hymenobacter negativus]
MFGNLFGPRYQYAVGDGVLLPARNVFFQVQWRGYLVLGPPGQRRRVPIYWLGEAHWDCYYEDELVPIESLPF